MPEQPAITSASPRLSGATNANDYRRFKVRLGLVVAVALVIRILYVVLAARKLPVANDAATYHTLADNLVAGHGYSRATPGGPAHLAGRSAEFPPLFPLFVAGMDKLGATTFFAQKLGLCAVGSATVALIGVLGRMYAGAGVGLIAAALAAVYPFLWIADGSMLSESLFGIFIAVALILAVRFVGRGSRWTALLLGIVVGLAALVRGEALLLLPLMCLPLAHRAPKAGRERALAFVLMFVGALAAIMPWTTRNNMYLHDPVLVSTNSSLVFRGANCGPTYHGPQLGSWSYGCYGRVPQDLPPGDESQRATAYRHAGLDYAEDHSGRLPVVLAVRLLRTWELYRPIQGSAFEAGEGRDPRASKLGLAFFYPLLILAAVGGVSLRRRKSPLIPFLAPVAAVCIIGITVYGSTRVRFLAEPALVVLAAVGLDGVLAWLKGRRAGSAVTDAPSRAAA